MKLLLAVDGSAISTRGQGTLLLIVMSSHGHTALQRLLLGSIASKVIAESPVPVTVVR